MSGFANFGGSNTNAANSGGLGAQNTGQPPSGSSLFGSNPNPLQPQPTQQSLFGGTGTTNAGGGSSLFGSSPNPLQPQPTLPSFGGTNAGGGLFGPTNTNTTNPTSTTGTGNLFGATVANPSGGTTQNTGTSLFGSTPAAGNTTSLFGGSTTNTNAPAQGGSSLFGNTGTQPLFGGTGSSTTNTTGSNLFGNTTSTNTGNTTGGNLFAPNTTSTTGAGGGLFGTSATNQGGTTGGLFGGANSGTAGGLFGSNTNTQQPASNTTATANLFGNTASSNIFGSKPAGTSLFGSTTSNPLFGGGQQQQQQQQQPLFGASTTNSLFGSTNKTNPSQLATGLTASTFASSSLLASRPAASQQQPADAQAQFQKLLQGIEAIYSAWSPQSRDCRFQYPFYNLVDPKQVGFYGRPPNAANDAFWEKALRENPDPSCLVPVIAIGFDDLRARVDAQSTQSGSHLQKLKDIQSRLDALRTQHSVSNSSRILRSTALQTQLSQRVLHLVQHLHLLIPSVRSSALRPEEEVLRGKLEEIDEDLRRGRIKGRLNELWALVGAIGAGSKRAGGGSEGDWAVVDDEGLSQIVQILAEQQVGLQHLTKILQKDLKDLAVITGTKSSGSLEEAEAEAGDNLWTSTSALRASALR